MITRLLPTEKQTYLKSNKSFTKGEKNVDGEIKYTHIHFYLDIQKQSLDIYICKKLVIMVTYRIQVRKRRELFSEYLSVCSSVTLSNVLKIIKLQ